MLFPSRQFNRALKHGWRFDGMSCCFIWLVRLVNGRQVTISLGCDGKMKFVYKTYFQWVD